MRPKSQPPFCIHWRARGPSPIQSSTLRASTTLGSIESDEAAVVSKKGHQNLSQTNLPRVLLDTSSADESRDGVWKSLRHYLIGIGSVTKSRCSYYLPFS